MVRLAAEQNGYKRPPKTFQETLSTEQIKEKLKDYTKVEDISKVPIRTHVRYFVYQKDPQTNKLNRLFRLGGRLVNKDHYDKYVVLSNGKHSWSVNTSTAIFFRQMNPDEIHTKYEEQMKSLRHTVKSLQHKLQQAGLNSNGL